MKWTGNHLCVFVNIINQKSIIPILKKKVAKCRHTDWQSRKRIQVWCMLKLITIPLIKKISQKVCLTYLNGMELNVETTGRTIYGSLLHVIPYRWDRKLKGAIVFNAVSSVILFPLSFVAYLWIMGWRLLCSFIMMIRYWYLCIYLLYLYMWLLLRSD